MDSFSTASLIFNCLIGSQWILFHLDNLWSNFSVEDSPSIVGYCKANSLRCGLGIKSFHQVFYFLHSVLKRPCFENETDFRILLSIVADPDLTFFLSRIQSRIQILQRDNGKF